MEREMDSTKPMETTSGMIFTSKTYADDIRRESGAKPVAILVASRIVPDVAKREKMNMSHGLRNYQAKKKLKDFLRSCWWSRPHEDTLMQHRLTNTYRSAQWSSSAHRV